MDWMCTRCGSQSYHYNRTRMQNECDGCGHPVADSEQERQQMAYDRTLAQAQNHLIAGNWNQTISLLQPLLNQQPTDKRLYCAILRAATKDYRDIAMMDENMRAAASGAWEKLVRLNGCDGSMIRYSKQRYQKHLQELQKRRKSILARLFVASGLFWCAAFCLVQSMMFWACVCITVAVCCLYRMFSWNPAGTIRQLAVSAPDFSENPFE